VGLLVALVAVAVVLFVVFSGGDDDGGSEDATTTTATQATTTTAEPAFEVVRIRDGAPVGGVLDLTYQKGDEVRLRVFPESGVEEIHVHGYELEKEVEGTKPVSFVFTADIDGGFEVEAHTHSGEFEIAHLEVRP
jgi:FtsP/CotA-like multicopper oxidase with cupredoxin domain